MVTRLFLGLGVINRVPVHSWRRPSLKPLEVKAKPLQGFGQLNGGLRVIRAGLVLEFADDDLTPGGRPDRQNHCLGVVSRPGVGDDPLDGAVFYDQVVNHPLA